MFKDRHLIPAELFLLLQVEPLSSAELATMGTHLTQKLDINCHGVAKGHQTHKVNMPSAYAHSLTDSMRCFGKSSGETTEAQYRMTETAWYPRDTIYISLTTSEGSLASYCDCNHFSVPAPVCEASVHLLHNRMVSLDWLIRLSHLAQAGETRGPGQARKSSPPNQMLTNIPLTQTLRNWANSDLNVHICRQRWVG